MFVGTKPGLAAVGSATVAVLSESSSIEQPFFFFAMRRGHMLYNNCSLYNSAVVSTTVVTAMCIVHARSVL